MIILILALLLQPIEIGFLPSGGSVIVESATPISEIFGDSLISDGSMECDTLVFTITETSGTHDIGHNDDEIVFDPNWVLIEENGTGYREFYNVRYDDYGIFVDGRFYVRPEEPAPEWWETGGGRTKRMLIWGLIGGVIGGVIVVIMYEAN